MAPLPPLFPPVSCSTSSPAFETASTKKQLWRAKYKTSKIGDEQPAFVADHTLYLALGADRYGPASAIQKPAQTESSVHPDIGILCSSLWRCLAERLPGWPAVRPLAVVGKVDRLN